MVTVQALVLYFITSNWNSGPNSLNQIFFSCFLYKWIIYAFYFTSNRQECIHMQLIENLRTRLISLMILIWNPATWYDIVILMKYYLLLMWNHSISSHSISSLTCFISLPSNVLSTSTVLHLCNRGREGM